MRQKSTNPLLTQRPTEDDRQEPEEPPAQLKLIEMSDTMWMQLEMERREDVSVVHSRCP